MVQQPQDHEHDLVEQEKQLVVVEDDEQDQDFGQEGISYPGKTLTSPLPFCGNVVSMGFPIVQTQY